MHHVLDGAGLTHNIEPPEAGVSVAGVEGLKAVAQVSLTGHLSQFTGQVLQSWTQINTIGCLFSQISFLKKMTLLKDTVVGIEINGHHERKIKIS